MSPLSRPALRTPSAALLLVLLTAAVYLPAVRGGFIWDDSSYITDNPTLRSGDGLRRIWLEVGATPQYYPMVFTSFWAEYRLWRLDPQGYHLVNVGLHGLAAILLWFALRRLTLPGAWLAAALFALHPVQVESVAWITERKNVLSGVWYLAAGLWLLRFYGIGAAEPEGREEGARRPWGSYLAAVVCFGCALLSKSVTATLPAAGVLVLWWKRGRLRLRDLAPLAPLLAMGAACGLVTAWVERTVVGARGSAWALTPAERLLVAGRALWFYAGKLVFPSRLTFIYPRWSIDASDPRQYLYPAGVLCALGALWATRSRIGKGPLTALLFFAGTAAPALGFIDFYPMRYSFVADHFQYLAAIGPLALAAAAIAGRRPGRARIRAAVVPAAILLALGGLTWRQAHAYRDRETLWRDTLEKNPGAWIAHNNLGIELAQQGRRAEAAEHFAASARLNPASAQAYVNQGTLLASRGRFDEAIALLRMAARADPYDAKAHSNLGVCLLSLGRAREAAEEFRLAVQLRPDLEQARQGLAAALAALPKPGS